MLESLFNKVVGLKAKTAKTNFSLCLMNSRITYQLSKSLKYFYLIFIHFFLRKKLFKNFDPSHRDYSVALTAEFKDTRRIKAPSNKNSALTKNMNMDICVVGTSNQVYRKRFLL